MSYDDESDGERADRERGEFERAQDRLDRVAAFAPSPDDVSTVAFLAAADRGTAIWNASDGKAAMGRAVGIAMPDLLNIAKAHIEDSEGAYDHMPAKAREVALVADAFLLGILIGRELPKP